MIEEIREIEKYEENPQQTPIQVSEKLLTCINPRFRFIQLLGIGGEGILLKSLDETGKQIVVKVARSAYQGKYATTPKGNQTLFNVISFKGKPKATNSSYERFLEGAKLQRDLFQQISDDQETNFSVPQVYMISQDPLFFIMPYLENTNILRFLKDFKKNLRESLTIFVYLLRSIEYIHSKGIIHRDLKADNLMIGNKLKSIVILDWTLSKIAGNRGLTVQGTISGTPGLAPIKFMDGEFINANFLDDIYSLGFVLWEFVTGKRIATIWRPTEKDEKITKQKIEDFKRLLIKFLPECLYEIFWKATEVDEKKRFQEAVSFKNALVKVMSEFELNTCTLVSAISEKQLEEQTEIIFDTECEIDFCKNCKIDMLCKNYGMCNLLDKAIKQYFK